MKFFLPCLLLVFFSVLLNAQVVEKPVRKMENGRYGFYLNNGWVIPPEYDSLPKEYADFIVAKKNKKCGLIDGFNNIIQPIEYEKFRRPPIRKNKNSSKSLQFEYADYYIVEKDGLKGVCDLKGNFLLPLKYSELRRIKNGNISLGNEIDGFGIIKLDGSVVISQTYEERIKSPKAGVYMGQKKGKIGFFDKDEKILMPFTLEEVKDVGNGLYHIKENGKWGIMTNDLIVKIQPTYDYIENKYSWLSMTILNKKKGAISSEFKEIIPPVYYDLDVINRSCFRVQKEKKDWVYGVIDTLGNEILPFEFDEVKGGVNLIFARKKGNRLFAMYNEAGEEVTPPTYYDVTHLNKGFNRVSQKYNGKFALMNEKGKVLTPFIYGKIKNKSSRNREKSSVVFEAIKSDTIVLLDANGQEKSENRNEIERRQDKSIQDAQNKSTIRTGLKGEWFGVSKIGQKKFFAKINFIDDYKGVRTTYFTENEKEYEISQDFNLQLTSLKVKNTLYVEVVPSSELKHEHEKLPPAIRQSMFLKFNQGLWSCLKEDKFYIKGYQKKRDDWKNLTTTELRERARKVYNFEEDLKTKIKSHLGKIYRHEILAITNEQGDNEVKIRLRDNIIDFGKFQIRKDECVFVPRAWSEDANYFLAGTINNVRFVDKKGKEKVGNLDILCEWSKKDVYFFKETP